MHTTNRGEEEEEVHIPAAIEGKGKEKEKEKEKEEKKKKKKEPIEKVTEESSTVTLDVGEHKRKDKKKGAHERHVTEEEVGERDEEEGDDEDKKDKKNKKEKKKQKKEKGTETGVEGSAALPAATLIRPAEEASKEVPLAELHANETPKKKKKKDKKKEAKEEQGAEPTTMTGAASSSSSSAAAATTTVIVEGNRSNSGSNVSSEDISGEDEASLRRQIKRLQRLNTSLQKENESLRSSPAPTPVKGTPGLTGVAGDAELEQIRAENRRLKKKCKRLESEGSPTPGAAAAAPVPAPAAPLAAGGEGKGKGDFKRYQREIKSLHEENSRYSFEFGVMRQIFETASELTFMTQDMPLAAVKINEALGAAHAYERPGDAGTYRGILDMLPMAYNVKSDGFVYAFYWVQTIYSVLKTAAVKLDRPLLRTPADEDVFRIGARSSTSGDSSEGEDLISALEEILYDAYVVALSRVYVMLDAVAVQGILEAKSSSTNSNSNGNINSGGGGGNAGESGGLRSVVAALSNVVRAAREAHLSKGIIKQTIEQAYWCINGTLFNELIGRPECCTCGMALHIKAAISALESFATRDREFALSRKRLLLIKDTANLLMMDKKLLTDDEVFATAIPSLNMSQVLKILENFTPDSYINTPVEPSIMQLTRSRVNTRGRQQIKVDPHAFVQNISP